MKRKLLILIIFFCTLPPLALAENDVPLVAPITIHFLKGTAQVDNLGIQSLQNLAEDLKQIKVTKIVVEGYSDNTTLGAKNPYTSNEELSKARADSVVVLLNRQTKLPKNLFVSMGHGSTNQLAPNSDAAGRAKNRRVEVRVFGDRSGQEKEKVSKPKEEELISLSLRDVDIAEAYEMLAKSRRVNIVLDKGVTGKVSLNIFNVNLSEALDIIASSGGFAVDPTKIGYVVHQKVAVVEPPTPPIPTEVRTFEIKYSQADKVEEALSTHLSESGAITSLKARNLLIIKDTPALLDKMALLIKEIDREPQEFLIEAKILEVSLDETESFGLDWAKIFKPDENIIGLGKNSTGSVGVSGLNNSQTGFIFNLVNDNVNITLNALNEKGRVKTLSTPKLLTIEGQKASVIIGDRKGYTVTTTINQVTTTSVAFLESGIILDVTPTIDLNGRILLAIHPEVSSGSVTSGIPSQTTTEVTTSLLADDGQTVFIGGLLKQKNDYSKAGVPVLGDIPVLGRLFSNSKDAQSNTETVVLITPHIINKKNLSLFDPELQRIKVAEQNPKEEK